MAILKVGIKTKTATVTAEASNFVHTFIVVSDVQLTETEALFAFASGTDAELPDLGEAHPVFKSARVETMTSAPLDGEISPNQHPVL